MPPLSALAEAEAPGVLLQMLDLARRSGGEPGRGAVDLCLDIARSVPEWVESEPLYVSHLLGVAARGHPALAGVPPGGVIPVEVFVGLRHALVAGDGATRGTVDAALDRAGLSRRVVLTLPHFHAVAMAAAESTIVAALPRALRPRGGAAAGARDLPAAGAGALRSEMRMYWHARDARRPRAPLAPCEGAGSLRGDRGARIRRSGQQPEGTGSSIPTGANAPTRAVAGNVRAPCRAAP